MLSSSPQVAVGFVLPWRTSGRSQAQGLTKVDSESEVSPEGIRFLRKVKSWLCLEKSSLSIQKKTKITVPEGIQMNNFSLSFYSCIHTVFAYTLLLRLFVLHSSHTSWLLPALCCHSPNVLDSTGRF